MSHTGIGIQKAVVLWLSGAQFADIRALPQVETLMKQGAMVELEPSPIVEPLTRHYQVLSGQLPENFGFFDTLIPQNYAIIEESSGRGVPPKLLPDVLRTVGWTVRYEETRLSNMSASVQSWIESTSTLPSCLLIKSVVQNHIEATDLSDIAQALRL